MFDAVAIGELLIDFTPINSNEMKGSFKKNAGGAPANVLAMLSKQGLQTAFIGKVGNDLFGTYLADTLQENGVSIEGLVYSETENTTIAFVELDHEGERSFAFYRKPGADMMLRSSEVRFDLINQAKLFHFGSVSMTHEPSRSATISAVEYAKQKGALISFDPNVRPLLWESPELAKQVISQAIPYADVLKLSAEELEFIVGTNNVERGAKAINDIYQTPLICITMGAEGSYYHAGSIAGYCPPFPVQTKDTTGAGDAFLGGVLFRLLELGLPISEITEDGIREITAFGNASGSLATSKMGAIDALPAKEEVMQLLK